MMEFVSWAYYSQYMESHKISWFQTTNQPFFSIQFLGPSDSVMAQVLVVTNIAVENETFVVDFSSKNGDLP